MRPVEPNGSVSIATPPAFLLVRDDHRGHRYTGFRPPRRHPFRQPSRRVAPEPGDDCLTHQGRLLRSRRRGHVKPAAAELRVAALVRMYLQAVVAPEVQDALAADELTRRQRRAVGSCVPESPHDPLGLPGHDAVKLVGSEVFGCYEQHGAGGVHRHRHRLLPPCAAADGVGKLRPAPGDRGGLDGGHRSVRTFAKSTMSAARDFTASASIPLARSWRLILLRI